MELPSILTPNHHFAAVILVKVQPQAEGKDMPGVWGDDTDSSSLISRRATIEERIELHRQIL